MNVPLINALQEHMCQNTFILKECNFWTDYVKGVGKVKTPRGIKTQYASNIVGKCSENPALFNIMNKFVNSRKNICYTIDILTVDGNDFSSVDKAVNSLAPYCSYGSFYIDNIRGFPVPYIQGIDVQYPCNFKREVRLMINAKAIGFNMLEVFDVDNKFIRNLITYNANVYTENFS